MLKKFEIFICLGWKPASCWTAMFLFTVLSQDKPISASPGMKFNSPADCPFLSSPPHLTPIPWALMGLMHQSVRDIIQHCLSYYDKHSFWSQCTLYLTKISTYEFSDLLFPLKANPNYFNGCMQHFYLVI